MNEALALPGDNEVRVNPTENRKPMIRILIADDHPIVRDGLRKLLSLEDDFEIVAEANDGREVLDKVQELDPDVLLLDLRMPNLDGLAMVQRIRDNHALGNLPVLFLTGQVSQAVVAERLGPSAGAFAYLRKPTDSGLLQKKVLSLLCT